MAKVTAKYFDGGMIGGWTAVLEIDGKAHRVPSKLVTDHMGSSFYATYDNLGQAKQAARRHARNLLERAA